MLEHSKGDFFAVSREHFHAACDLGMGPAVAYLVIACGTGRNQSESKWSTGAIGKYAGINFKRAIQFIDALAEAGLLINAGTRQKPLYKLTINDDYVWLPNSIIVGAKGETPAVCRLRQTRDVPLLRLFVDLYYHQNLGHDGGIDPEIVSSVYEIRRLGEAGPFQAYAVERISEIASTWEHLLAHDELELWWERFIKLLRMGLVVEAVYLFDGPITTNHDTSPDGEFVYSIAGPSAEESNRATLEEVGEDWLGNAIANEDRRYLALVPMHINSPLVAGIYRMKHTAHTAAASTWWAKINEANRRLFKMMGREHVLLSAVRESMTANK